DRRRYVAREASASARRIVDEEEVHGLLARYEFERVYMEDLSVAEQIELATQAAVIAGPHGAGMLHTLFMEPGGTVFEFFPPTCINYATTVPCKLLGHRYTPIVSEVLDGTYEHGQAVKVPVDVLELVLETELKHQRRAV